MGKQNFYKTVTINPTTGEVEHFFPLELTPENRTQMLSAAKLNGYNVGYSKIGYRTFEAVMIPVTAEELKELCKEELANQDAQKINGRCQIPAQRGHVKRCPRQIPNPNYGLPGEPKTIMNSCENCPYNNDKKSAVTELNFSALDKHNDATDETEQYDPVAPDNYFSGDKYERLSAKFIKFVADKYPKYTELARERVQEFSMSEIAKVFDKPEPTIRSQNHNLKDIVQEFLDTVITL